MSRSEEILQSSARHVQRLNQKALIRGRTDHFGNLVTAHFCRRLISKIKDVSGADIYLVDACDFKC